MTWQRRLQWFESKGIAWRRKESGRDEGFTYCPSITGFHVDPSHWWTPRWRGGGVCAKTQNSRDRVDYINMRNAICWCNTAVRVAVRKRNTQLHRHRERNDFRIFIYFYLFLILKKLRNWHLFLFLYRNNTTHLFCLSFVSSPCFLGLRTTQTFSEKLEKIRLIEPS